MFLLGHVYKRTAIHDTYQGNRQSGIAPSAHYNVIFLFSGSSGQEYGYEDGWQENNIFWYSGEGTIGDMEFKRGNLAIRDHIKNGKELHLFDIIGDGNVRYVGQMLYVGHHFDESRDKDGNRRKRIVFELEPIEADYPDDGVYDTSLDEMYDSSLKDLRKHALAAAVESVSAKEIHTKYRERSRIIKVYALKRADGICEGCGQPAPFHKLDGIPYLEVHHIKKLSDDGPDDPTMVISLCPNCHRRAHYASDADAFNGVLESRVKEIEEKLS